MPRFITCWVCYSLIGTVFLGQACNEGLHPDHTAGPTETQHKEQGGPKSPLLSTKAVADYIFTGPTSGEVHQAAVFRVALNDAVRPTGIVRFTPSASNGDGTFSPVSLDLSDTTRSGSFSYTPTRSGSRSIAIANNGGLTDPAPVSFNSKAQTGTSKVHAGFSYFISPKSTCGAGTRDNPFGIPDLINTTAEPYVTPGPALTILRPGDTLHFLAGTYNISGSTNPAYYGGVMLCPTTSGTATQPITISAYPGATVNINEVSGDQPVFGTCYPVLNYVRFLGFTITMGPGVPIPADNNALDAAPAFYIGGTGNEVGYCTVIGSYMPTSDNHDGIRIEHANDSWIHHNIITGVKGNSQNSAGIKLYTSTNTIISDNYIYGCTTGMVDKFAHSPDNTTNSTYTRNFVTDCPYAPFLGNGYAAQANFYIYDNVFDGNVNLGALNTDSQVYNNLIRNATQVFNGQLKFYNVSIWNNIAISRGPAITAFVDESVAFVPRGSRAPLQYIDYNVYDRAPSYSFGSYASQKRVFNLSQMRARGFEQHARVVRSDLTIFQDLTSYQLRPQWTTAGRNGDPVGPRFPIAKILDTSRYGPQALGTGSSPIFTQRPENQSAAVGGRATFSVRVSASGLLYQWQRSNDGGKTWITIQSANSAVYTIPQVATSDNGTVFRCLAACIGGSVWSDTATLSVNAAAAPLTTQPSP